MEQLSSTTAGTREEAKLLEVGTYVDHFRVMRLLGQGGMAQVYLARDTRLGRKVALKMIRPTALGTRDAVDRFLFEAKATALFSHPHIVTIYAVGEYQERPYVALEYLEGQTLKERLEEAPPSGREALRIAGAIAQALAEAHRRQLLHRDLKPENVIIPRDGRLRVVDFGLAKVLEDRDVTVRARECEDEPTDETDLFTSREEGLRGTPLYMAPEQWLGQAPTSSVDVWALGLILFEMLAGRLPYQASTAVDLAVQVCNPDPAPEPPEALALPNSISTLLARCLEKEPEQRPTAEQVADRLSELLDTRPAESLNSEESPFRGLLPFSERHAAFFFGREAELEAFLERLREEPMLPVVGPSGAGKSSFVQAGVIPRLREQGHWIVLRLRPGAHPMLTLAAKLSSGESTVLDKTVPSIVPPPMEQEDVGSADEDLAAQLVATPKTLNLTLERLATQSQGRVLLFVDQLEELYTLCQDDQERRAFMTALCTGADDPQEPVRVIFTLRDDFLGRLAEGAEVREALSRLTLLRSPDTTALREILTRPVELVGYRYDDPSLVDDMIAAVGGEAVCLPLLQFVTRTLWDRRDRSEKLLLRSVYEEVGGVGGALAHHADGVLEGMSEGQVSLARHVLLLLVTAEGTRRTVPRTEVLEAVGARAEELLDRLVAARLISVRTARARPGSGSVLELAHESLIRSWGRLSRWVDESREELSLVNEIEQAAELWDRRGCRTDELWSDAALAETERRLSQMEPNLSERAARFLDAADHHRRQRLRRARTQQLLWSAGLLLITVIALGVAVAFSRQRERALDQRARARQRWAEVQREGARYALERGELLEARARLRTSLQVHDSLQGRALWWQLEREPLRWNYRLSAAAYDVALSPDGQLLAVASQDEAIHLLDMATTEERALRGHDDQVFSVAFSPDGRTLASGTWSGELRLWNLDTGQFQRLEGHDDQVWVLSYSPSGELLASASYDATIKLWRPDNLDDPIVLEEHRAPVGGVAFSSTGEQLATTGFDSLLCLWSAPFDGPPQTKRVPLAQDIAFSPDDQTLALAGTDGAVRLVEADTLTQRRLLRGPEVEVNVVAFSHDGRRLATAGHDGSVVIWDLDRDEPWAVMPGDRDVIHALSWSPDDRQLVTVSFDGAVHVWDATTEVRPRPPSAHSGATRDAEFLASGARIASGGSDGTIRLWEVDSGRVTAVISGHDRVVSALAAAPTGVRLASGGDDHSIRVWNTDRAAEERTLTYHEDVINSLSYGPRGLRLVSGGADLSVVVWDLLRGTPARVFVGHRESVQDVAVSSDGLLAASASLDGTVRLWQLDAGQPGPILSEGTAGVWGVDFSPSGQQLVTADESGVVRLWDLEAGTSRVVGRQRGRIYSVAFSPDGRQLATAASDGLARLWDLDSGVATELRGHRAEVNSVAFSPDGTLLVTSSDDGTVRLWSTSTGRARWRAPLLVTDAQGSRLLTHRGWLELTGEARSSEPRPSERAWERRVEELGGLAAVDPSGRWLCLQSDDDQVELWDIRADRRVSRTGLPSVDQLLGHARGCLVRAGPSLRLLEVGGTPRTIRADGVEAVSTDGELSEVLVASGDRVILLSLEGEELWARQIGPRARVMRQFGDVLAVGFDDGAIELSSPGAEVRAPSAEGTPSSAVVTLAEGPRSTLVAGFANGVYGLWELSSGAKLWQQHLHGSVHHLSFRGDHLVAATDLGDEQTLDLSPLHIDECELLRRVWRRVPAVWSRGAVRPAAPPRDHRCSER